ncbi:MAG: tetratricopeptide repeat protein [Lewinellaceae bacterium]|nr:tetratricopeptide repeat protein [Lewinellaceae bacterium]
MLRDAIQLQENTIGKEHPDYAISLNNLALLYQEANRMPQSSIALLELNKLYRYRIENSAAYSSENQMLAYLRNFENDFDYFLSFSQNHPNSELIGASFDNALFQWLPA